MYVLAMLAVVVGAVLLFFGFQTMRWGDGGALLNAAYFQLGLSLFVSAALFAGFGRLLELVEHIAKVGNTLLARPVPVIEPPLMLEQVAAPVRVLRSLGDMDGGLNDRQMGSVVDFVGFANGVALSQGQKEHVSRWVAVLATPLEADLAQLRHLSPELTQRFRAALGAVVAHGARRPQDQSASERVKAAAVRIGELLPS